MFLHSHCSVVSAIVHSTEPHNSTLPSSLRYVSIECNVNFETKRTRALLLLLPFVRRSVGLLTGMQSATVIWTLAAQQKKRRTNRKKTDSWSRQPKFSLFIDHAIRGMKSMQMNSKKKTFPKMEEKEETDSVCTLYNVHKGPIFQLENHSNTGTNTVDKKSKRKNIKKNHSAICQYKWKRLAKDVKPTSWMSYSFVWFRWFRFISNKIFFSFFIFHQ